MAGRHRCDCWPSSSRIRSRAPSSRPFAGAQRPVVEYLTTDVLALLEPDVQDFVLKVSILTRMSGALCDAVVGRSGSGAVLAELERASLFMSIDSAGDWYSQHHLFAEAMRLELARTQHELLPTLHLRAARWFEESGDLESAADHAIESRDVALAARLIATQVESLAARGRWATIYGWLAELSWPAAMADPELAWVRATSDSFSHDLEGAERWLDVASKGAADAEGSLGPVLWVIASRCSAPWCWSTMSHEGKRLPTGLWRSRRARSGEAPPWRGSDRLSTYGVKPPRHGPVFARRWL